MGSLLLIRHGQASYGDVDYDRLSTRGQEQARRLGAALAKQRFDAVYAGPHVRQQQTIGLAREVAPALPTPVTLDEFAEYPAFEILKHLLPRLVAEDPRFAALATTFGGGAPVAEAPAVTPRLLDDAFQTLLARWSNDDWTVAGVERVGEFVARVRAGLDGIIRAASAGARIACVTSAGPIGVAVGLAFGIAHVRMVRTSIVVRNTSITELKFKRQGFDWQPDQLSVVTFNLTSHLPEELDTHR